MGQSERLGEHDVLTGDGDVVFVDPEELDDTLTNEEMIESGIGMPLTEPLLDTPLATDEAPEASLPEVAEDPHEAFWELYERLDVDGRDDAATILSNAKAQAKAKGISIPPNL